jgi:hypothetical protein
MLQRKKFYTPFQLSGPNTTSAKPPLYSDLMFFDVASSMPPKKVLGVKIRDDD